MGSVRKIVFASVSVLAFVLLALFDAGSAGAATTSGTASSQSFSGAVVQSVFPDGGAAHVHAGRYHLHAGQGTWVSWNVTTCDGDVHGVSWPWRQGWFNYDFNANRQGRKWFKFNLPGKKTFGIEGACRGSTTIDVSP